MYSTHNKQELRKMPNGESPWSDWVPQDGLFGRDSTWLNPQQVCSKNGPLPKFSEMQQVILYHTLTDFQQFYCKCKVKGILHCACVQKVEHVRLQPAQNPLRASAFKPGLCLNNKNTKYKYVYSHIMSYMGILNTSKIVPNRPCTLLLTCLDLLVRRLVQLSQFQVPNVDAGQMLRYMCRGCTVISARTYTTVIKDG